MVLKKQLSRPRIRLSTRRGSNTPATSLPVHSATIAYLNFLSQIDTMPALYFNKRVLTNAVRRYETLWLPMLLRLPVAKHRALLAPLDIEWVWCLHLLAPSAYRQDVIAVARANKLPYPSALSVDHAVLVGDDRDKGLRKARQLWQENYGDEPFSVTDQIRNDAPQDDTKAEDDGYKSLMSHDLVAAAARQSTFAYQVTSLPHYRDKSFLANAAVRYFNSFMVLQKVAPDRIWVPSYDIDLMWHMHLMFASTYALETIRQTGRLVRHDDTDTRHESSGSAQSNWKMTRKAWRMIFNEDISVNGAMWRGDICMQERCIQSTLEELIAASERKCQQLFSRGHRQLSIVGADRLPDVHEKYASDIAWIHLNDMKGAPTVAPHCTTERIERFTSLKSCTDEDETILYQSRTIHQVLSEGSVASAIEIYPCEKGALPIATAHTIDQRQMATERTQIDESPELATLGSNEKALLLRIGGQDVAILIGHWSGFSAPQAGYVSRDGRQHTHARAAKAGNLVVRLGVLRDGKGRSMSVDRVWRAVSFHAERRMISAHAHAVLDSYLMDGGGGGGGGGGGAAHDDVGRRRQRRRPGHDDAVQCKSAKDMLLEYLISMSTAMLYVMLQPRFEPDDAARIASMYPHWSDAQRGIAILEGAGGEMAPLGALKSYGALVVQSVHAPLRGGGGSGSGSGGSSWLEALSDDASMSFSRVSIGASLGRMSCENCERMRRSLGDVDSSQQVRL